jgi:DNA-binding MurR/RpiR family transcriptional regulator
VAARRDTLSPAEQSVARYMSDNPQEVAFASAEELGRLTGTSDATVIRTVKALGYPGLPSLKGTLREGLRERLTPTGGPADHRANIFDTVVGEQVKLLETARRSLRPAEFAKAVNAINAAPHLLTCSVGVLGPLAEYFTARMLRQGRHARSVSASGFLLADALVPLSKGDAVVLITYGRVKPEDDVIIEHAERVGARVVVVTDILREALIDRVDAVLSADLGRHDALSSMTVAVAILEALTIAFAASDAEQVAAAASRLTEVRERLAEVIADDVTGARRKRGR